MSLQYGALSGVAIVLIALNHTIHFGFQIVRVEGGWLNALIVLQALGAFAVPAFLFISGSFVSYSANQLSLQFVRSSLERILWPYLIWSALFYAMTFVMGGERYSAFGYGKNLLVGYPYHFVPLLVFWYLAAPLVVRAGRHHGVVLLVAVGAYQALLLSVRFPEMFGGWDFLRESGRLLRLPVLFTSMSDWALYFPMGLVLGMHHKTVKDRLLRLRGPMVAAAAALFLLGILDAFQLVDAPWARFAAPVPLMFVLPTVSRSSIPQVKRLEFLGRRSYGIYLSHFVIVNLAVFLVGPVTGVVSQSLVFPAGLAVALGAPLLLMDVFARPAATRDAFRFVFGFAPPTPVRQTGSLSRTRSPLPT